MPKVSANTRQYELTYLLQVGYTDSEVMQIKKEIEEIAKKRKGTVDKVEDWGKKPLAYKLKKTGKTHEEAVYVYTEMSFEPTQAQAFERDMYLNAKVLRHLFVIAGDEEAFLGAAPVEVVE